MIPDDTRLNEVLPDRLVQVMAQMPKPITSVGELRRANHREVVVAMMRSQLLTPKLLAIALGRHRNYIEAMKRRGFMMPGGLATLDEARAWLVRNPPPRSRHADRLAA